MISHSVGAGSKGRTFVSIQQQDRPRGVHGHRWGVRPWQQRWMGKIRVSIVFTGFGMFTKTVVHAKNILIFQTGSHCARMSKW